MLKVQSSSRADYSMVEFDKDGWADAKRFIPADFDLCLLKIKGKNKNEPGWASGRNWDGLRIKKDDEVLFWKRQ